MVFGEDDFAELTKGGNRAASPPAHGSLEAMAVCADQSAGVAQTGHFPQGGDPHRLASQRTVALVSDAGDADRHDQSVDQRHAGARLDTHPVDLPSLSDLNRRVRTRMLGGVGAGEGDLPGYPISWRACPMPQRSLV